MSNNRSCSKFFYNYNIEGVFLDRINEVKNLLFGEKLTFNNHIKFIKNNVWKY